MSDVERNPSCPSGGRADTAALYLAGRLSASEAEAFEEHSFSCPDCREDVRRGAELRETLGKPAIVFAAPERRSAPRWLPLAAAAAIAIVGIGLWQVAHRAGDRATAPVLRGGGAALLHVRVEGGPPGRLSLSWVPLPRASRYVVRVLTPDGRSVWSSETREARLTIDPAALAAAKPGAALEVQVEALDAMESVVATSEPAPLPVR